MRIFVPSQWRQIRTLHSSLTKQARPVVVARALAATSSSNSSRIVLGTDASTIVSSSSSSRWMSTATTPPPPPPAVSNSTVPRTAISLLGAVNAGKSVLMNLLTQSQVSIVHETAGTTTDPKIAAMELHGRIGPIRLLDTPGINEVGDLGTLKRERALHTIGQCDVAVVVADPFAADESVESVAAILQEVKRRQEMNDLIEDQSPSQTAAPGGKDRPVALLVFNLREDMVKQLEASGDSVSLLIDEFEQKILDKMTAAEEAEADSDDDKEKKKVEPTLPPTLAVDFANVKASRERMISFLERYADPRPNAVNVLPDWVTDTHAEGHSPTVFLNIPMDQQTPSMRLLRPQAMVQEALIRNFVSTYAYRMDLGLARFGTPTEQQKEKDRFLKTLDPLLASGDLSLLITDSQAIDTVAPWTLDEQGNEIVPITTFSITMIRYLSGGRLEYFAEGLGKLDHMISGQVPPSRGDQYRVLITEACNHTRLNMEKQCADIGTVQLPNHLNAVLGEDNVEFEYAFGKHVIIDDPARYDLVVHCGGCMLNPQQMDSRVADLMAAGVPATNYGLLLSQIESPRTLARVLKPWGITYEPEGGQSQDAA